MAARRIFTTEELQEAIFQDSGSEFGGNASDSDFEYSLASDVDSPVDESSSSSDDDVDMGEPEQSSPTPRVEQRTARTGDRQAGPAIEWEVYEDIDPYESEEWLQEYNERQGILVDTSNFGPVDFFHLFMPDAAFELIATETNRYAMQHFDSSCDLSPNSRFQKWKDTSKDEIKAFVALQIAMGLNQKPSIRSYWGKFWLTYTPFTSVMSRNKFELIQTFLHFNNSEEQVPREQEGFNPLFKIQPLLDIVDPTYRQYYCPRMELSLDESMVKFKGRIFFRQYLPAKPTKWGIKEFVLAEAKTGYALKSIVYTGKNSFQRKAGVPLSEQVVLDLLEGFEDKGHRVYMDSFYSSPNLFLKLKEKNIGACGTVNSNRKGMPQQLKPSSLSLKKGDPPVFMRKKDDDLIACAWHDTKRLSLISTIDNNLTFEKDVRSRGDASGYRNVEKPVLAEKYNYFMGGVDTLDQLLGTYQYPHKSQKWYHTIYHRVREVALVNGYILYKKASALNKLDAKQFREQVIDGLLKNWEPPRQKVGRPSLLAPELRLTERHFPDKFENPKFKPDCRVCSDREAGRRVQTRFFCKQCDVPLCVVPCFERYHTLKEYKS